MCRALPDSEYYGGSAPPAPFSGRCAYPGQRGRMPAAGTRDRAVPVFTVHSLGEGGARLCPSGLATSTPQTFPVASRRAVTIARR